MAHRSTKLAMAALLLPVAVSGRTFQCFSEPKTQSAAATHCQSLGQVLATPCDVPEQQELHAAAKAAESFVFNHDGTRGCSGACFGTPSARKCMWLGGAKVDAANWLLPDGFHNFNRGEPNNFEGVAFGSTNAEDCLAMDECRSGGWNDVPCHIELGYCCASEACANEITVTQEELHETSAGHAKFECVRARMNQSAAAAHCAELGMELATPCSQEENEWMLDHAFFAFEHDSARGTGCSGACFFSTTPNTCMWLGMSDLEEQGEWMVPSTYQKFSHCEPNNYCGHGEHCSTLDACWQGGWNDVTCDLKLPFCCTLEPCSGTVRYEHEPCEELCLAGAVLVGPTARLLAAVAVAAWIQM